MEECGWDLLGWDVEVGNEWDNDPQLGWVPYPNGDSWEHEARMLDQLGFDYMSLIKGGAGMLSGAGGLLSGGGGGAAATPAAAAEAQRLAAEKAAAEASARTWKIVGGIALAAVGLGGVALVMRRPA